jgi:hypothetical protein
LLEVLERLVQSTTLAKQAAEQIVCVRVVRGQIERFAVGALGQLPVTGLMMLEAMAYSIGDLRVLFQG